jgi:hypothetical protein
MSLLSAADYPAIRAALDTAMDSAFLPDSVIGMSIYAGAGELAVLAKVPDAESRSGAELQRCKNAAVYLTAALLAIALPQIAAETFIGGESYQRKIVDPAALAAELRQRANAELDIVLTPSEVAPSRPTMFALARGRRGR